MKASNKLKLGFLVAILAMPMLPVQLVLAGEEQRAPPEARTSGTLGPQVMRAVSEIQELMTPEDPEDEPDLPRAKEALDDLYERRYERMNDFEKATVLNFYTNYYLTTENYPEAIRIFEQILTIEDLRSDVRLRTFKSLGQLYMSEEDWANSIRNYELWRDASETEDPIVFRGLSYAHYQNEAFAEALPHWLDYMDLNVTLGEEIPRDEYAYLNGLYFNLEDFESALEVTKTMIVKFDDPTDWKNLTSVYASLDDEERRVRSLNLAYLRGHLDDEAWFLNLGQSLGGLDIPFTGSRIIQDGIDQEFVEENEDNLQTLSQMHLIASDYEAAMAPALRVAEMSDSGDGWDTVGYLHYVMNNYEEAVEAFQNAVDKGNLSNESDTLLFLARSRMELDDFDGALEAARASGEAGDANARQAADNYVNFINSSRSRYNIIAERRQDAIDFYESYPSLID